MAPLPFHDADCTPAPEPNRSARAHDAEALPPARDLVALSVGGRHFSRLSRCRRADHADRARVADVVQAETPLLAIDPRETLYVDLYYACGLVRELNVPSLPALLRAKGGGGCVEVAAPDTPDFHLVLAGCAEVDAPVAVLDRFGHPWIAAPGELLVARVAVVDARRRVTFAPATPAPAAPRHVDALVRGDAPSATTPRAKRRRAPGAGTASPTCVTEGAGADAEAPADAR